MRRFLLLTPLCACLLLAACGGVYLGIEIGDDDDDDPDVELSASPSSVSSGQAVFLEASANDDSGFVEQVDFFRVGSDGDRIFLGSDLSRPYQLETTAPQVGTTGTVEYFARAYDGWGNRGESGRVSISVQP